MLTALITGITGQDGSYLAELLLSKGYRVVGVARRSSTVTYERIEHLLDDITVVQGDLHDQGSLLALLEEYKPTEVYNLAAQSFVPTSWNQPALTGEITALGVTRMLEAIRFVNPKIRFYQASSSEMFGKVVEVPQCETTSFYPRSPYGVARIKLGRAKGLRLGNLESQRDWGFAGDYVDAMWRMLQQDKPDNYVVGMGETHSVREFCDTAFGHVGLDYNDYVVQDEKFYRPAEVDLLISDPSKARSVLGWAPSITFKELVTMMVDADIERLSQKK